MITFMGLRIVVTDAVFHDHLKAEKTAIFCGPDLWPMFAAAARNPKADIGILIDAVQESLKAKRSVVVSVPSLRRSPCASDPW